MNYLKNASIKIMNTNQYLWPKKLFTKKPQNFPSTIDENIALGLDVGIGSCGQAVVSFADNPPDTAKPLPGACERILFMGVRAFDVPEENENSGVKLKNPERRKFRLLRRVTRRRALRMQAVRNLLKEQGVLPADYLPNDLRHVRATPLQWRVEGLDRQLNDWEWASVLIHLVKHRGFKSNRKSDLKESKGKQGGTLASTKANHEAIESGQYRTVGEMFLKDPRFAERKRNREGNYLATPLRDDQEAEIKLLFEKQRSFGNPHTSEEFEQRYLRIFKKQLPLQNPIKLLGDCPFEPQEKRCSLSSPSFELSRALQKLNTLSLILQSGTIVRLADFLKSQGTDYSKFISDFGKKKKITWADLRKIFSLPDTVQFKDLPVPKPKKKNKGQEKESSTEPETTRTAEEIRREAEKNDFVTTSSKRSAAAGTAALRAALGEDLWLQHWKINNPDAMAALDEAAFCLTFFEAIESTSQQKGMLGAMKDRKVPNEIIEKIKQDIMGENPTLLDFEGAASTSARFVRRLLPQLSNGLVYSDACKAIGVQHTQSDFSLENVTNPVVQSVVREVMKQVVFLVGQLGRLPGSICVELARDLGKSIKERNEMARGIEDRTDQKNARRAEMASHLDIQQEQVSDDALLRYELWLEQGGHCPYSFRKLPPPKELLNDNIVQVDHILPRSRSHDNSYHNKVLVYTSENQHKRNRTPFEWIGSGDPQSSTWREYIQKIHTCFPHLSKQKKRNLFNTTFATDEAKFAARNLQDTRYISRLIRFYLEDLYREVGEEAKEKGTPRRVFVQPGQLTAIVRRAWGLENLKKDDQGNRLGDKHHAVDALVCACLSEGQRQFVTRMEKIERALPPHFRDYIREIQTAYNSMENCGQTQATPKGLQPPWENFRKTVETALDRFHVSRRENRRGRGALHDATFYRRVDGTNGQGETYYKRTALVGLENGKLKAQFSKKDIIKVKDINDPRNAWLKAALEAWCNSKCPLDNLPRGPVPKKEKDNPNYRPPTVRTVQINRGYMSARKSPHGWVVDGDIVRVDVFSKPNRRNQKDYYLVPVYTYHLYQDAPPNRAIVANKPESEWEEMTEAFQFEFSLWKNSACRLIKPATAKKTAVFTEGLYTAFNRSTGAMDIKSLNDAKMTETVSVKKGVSGFQKLYIDRLGQIHVVPREKRTWRGKTL
jgi:CRISPR-associated endonuclease Csn1